jgi:hypothetical protein
MNRWKVHVWSHRGNNIETFERVKKWSVEDGALRIQLPYDEIVIFPLTSIYKFWSKPE